MSEWFVYILECGDQSLYTGITTDLDRRLEKHRQGKGAKYTRSRLPLRMVYSKGGYTRSTAAKEEWRIKGLTRKDKLKLIT